MADAVQPRRPNTRMTRLFNNLPKAILHSPLHGLMSKNVLLMTFRGRRSGKEYTTPLSYVQDGDMLLLGTQMAWHKNLIGGVPVRVRLRGQERSGTVDVISDEAGMRAAYQTILANYPGYSRFINVHLDPDGQVNRDDVTRAQGNGYVVIRVHLDPTNA
jgi:deazaflavin-dependent oxidoreductase (nitroreductase family)